MNYYVLFICPHCDENVYYGINHILCITACLLFATQNKLQLNARIANVKSTSAKLIWNVTRRKGNEMRRM